MIRFFRDHPLLPGWKLIALGIRDVEMEGMETLKEVAEVWVKDEVTREAAIAHCAQLGVTINEETFSCLV